MTATITNHLGHTITGQIRCWMGRRIVEIEAPDGTRHIGHLHTQTRTWRKRPLWTVPRCADE
jgi:hypothetical protein